MKFHQPLGKKIPLSIRLILFFKKEKISIDWGSAELGAYCIYKVHRGVVYILDHGEFE